MFLSRRGARAAAAAALILLVACGVGGSDGGLEAASPSVDGVIVLTDGTRAVDRGAGAATEGAISISSGEFFFAPTVITAPGGSELTITIENDGQNVHNFRITSQDVDVTFAEGGTETIVVRVPEAGAVTFDCEFHLPTNMRGEIRAA